MSLGSSSAVDEHMPPPIVGQADRANVDESPAGLLVRHAIRVASGPMAKVSLKAGATLDMLTPEEHAEHLVRLQHYFRDLMRDTEGETISRSADPFTTDATGGTLGLPRGGGGAYKVPIGYDAYLTRCVVDFEGSNAASPVSCDVRILADQNTPAATRAINNTLPSVYEASKSHAPMFRGGQEVVVSIQGGPATTKMYCTVQVILTPRKAISADILSEG